MYVCLCNCVTERKIRDAASEGVCTMQGLATELGVATGCGKCAPTARGLLLNQLAQITREVEAAEQPFDPASNASSL